METNAITRRNHITIGLILAFVLSWVIASHVQASSLQLGGWLSSKLFAQSGQPDSQILFARDGQADTFLIFTSSPVMVTGSATGVTYTSGVVNSGTATLNGVISSLNTLPSADVGFRWGYSAETMTNNTSTVHMTGTGAYSVSIANFDQTQPIYYQAIGVSDGIAYGIGEVFTTTRAVSGFTGYEAFLLIVPLLVWIALFFASGVLVFSGIKDIRNGGFGSNEAVNTALFKMAIAMILIVVAIVLFQLVPEAIQRIRII